MDLRNLCSKVDVDSIRAKIPQMKLPKSMSKLKSRKIFRSSREDVNSDSRRSSTKRAPANSENIPPSGLINRTPTRISTISSLMDQTGGASTGSKKWKPENDDDDENSYRSAGGIDDYPSPLGQRFEMRSSRPISPIKESHLSQQAHGQSEQNIKMSFGEKLQKGYKDVTEFKLKHLFAKRTVVRTDKIEISDYIQSFDDDRRQNERVQQKIDNDIAENYTFQFKESKQKSEESYMDDDDSAASSPQQTIEPKKNTRNLSELSGDESGMESSPPTRKPGIASTRFSKVRHTPLNMSLEDDYDKENNEDDDGDIELDVEEVDAPKTESNTTSHRDTKKSKSPEKINNSQQSLRRKSTKVSASSETPRDRPPPPPSRTPLNMSLDEDNDDDEDVDNDDDNDNYVSDDNIELDVVEVATPKKIKPNTSTLYDIKKQKTPEESADSQQNPRMAKSIKLRMSRLTKQKPENEDAAAVSDKKRKAPLSPQPSEENVADSTATASKSDKPFDAIKQNIKRIQKSVRLPQQMSTQSGAESENEEANSDNKTKTSKSQQFTERLKRFRSVDNVDKNPEDNETNESPIHKFTNKLHDWRKSFRKKADSHNTYNDDMDVTTSPQKQEKNVGSLMKKLKHIRARKRDSVDDPDDDEEGGDTYKESLAARAKFQLEKGKVVASQVPQKTMKKLSETKKYFKKKQDNEVKNKTEKQQSEEEDLDDDQENATSKPSRPPPPIPRPYFHNSSEDEDDDIDNHKFITKSIAESQMIAVPAATAVWATKPMIADDVDFDEELPRVLLHQDNSDIFESTLIIAVTRPISRNASPIITELPPDSTEESTPETKPDDWIPNQDMVATFLEMTPPTQRRLSKDSMHSRGHSRKHSIDSSSEDSWIKDIPKGPSTAHLNSVEENEEPWKIQKTNNEDILYKTKSIDLFEMQKQHGGVSTAFEDFDDELKNTPVVRIENENSSVVDIENKNATAETKNIGVDAEENKIIKTGKIEMENVNVNTVENENTPVIIEPENSKVVKVENESTSAKVELEEEESAKLEIPRNIDYYERGSSEELENPDDDNSSRVTKIPLHRRETKTEELPNSNDDTSSEVSKIIEHSPKPETEKLQNQEYCNSTEVVKILKKEELKDSSKVEEELVLGEDPKTKELQNPQDQNSSGIIANKTQKVEMPQYFGNSQESLTGNLDEKKLIDSGEESNHDQQLQEVDRPPSKTPSPPPTISTTPPSLPQRKSSISLLTSQPSFDLICASLPPPTLQPTKPPVPPKRTPPAPTPTTTATTSPPTVPDRNQSTTRVSKPLVKTASLRLAYSEQVNPEDVGKVNKLISRFEPEGNKQRPKIIPRKQLITYESDEYSDEEDLIQLLPSKPRDKIRDTTPTNPPRIQKSFSIDSTDVPDKNDNSTPNPEIHTSLSRKAISQISLDKSESVAPIPSISISSSCLDVNSNFSQPSSVYGSPLAFPSSLVGSTEVTPLTIRKDSEHLAMRRSRRSMARDDDHFYSFDSDEENSYYSISSTGSNRYVVDL